MAEPVHSLWCGPAPLDLVQLLTIKSFQQHGHPFILWTYTHDLKVCNDIELRDGREILPASEVYRVQGLGHDGSLAFFSDRFQLAFLLKHGGWWTHMDVLCLKPLDGLGGPYVFAPHWEAGVSPYLMRAPVGSEALKWMLDNNKWGEDHQPSHWHDAMRLMGEGVRRFGLTDRIAAREHLDDDGAYADEALFLPGPARPPTSRFVHHWCCSVHEAQSTAPPAGSFLHEIASAHGLNPECQAAYDDAANNAAPISFSVIVATGGTRESLREALCSIRKAGLLPNDEVLLVVDNADDALARCAWDEAKLPGLCLLAPNGPHGDWGMAARNFAMRSAKGTHLAFMDDDDCYRPGGAGSNACRRICQPKSAALVSIAKGPRDNRPIAPVCVRQRIHANHRCSKRPR